MKVNISHQLHPNFNELTRFFEAAFVDMDDNENFTDEQNQSLSEWFSVQEMIDYLPHGKLIEARTEDEALVGALFIGKQNPLSWNDGHKLEIFILGVDKNFRKLGIAKQLMTQAEDFAVHSDAKKILVNTHIAMTTVHDFYKKVGYDEIGTLRRYYDNGDAVFFQKVLK